MNNYNMDPDTFFHSLVERYSYVYLNALVPVVTRRFSPDYVEEDMNRLMNDQTFVKKLAFLTKISGISGWEEEGYHNVLKKLHNLQNITVEEWQLETKSSSLLVANQHYFTTAPIILIVLTSFDSDFWGALSNQIHLFESKNSVYYDILNNMSLGHLDEVLKFCCIYQLLIYKSGLEIFGGQLTPQRTQQFFAIVDKTAREYLS